MRMPKWLFLILLVAALGTLAGCARTMRNTEGFAITDSVTVNAPVDQAWQFVKEALREGKYDIYTRDKRGVFVAFTPMKRQMLLMPVRTKFTVAVEEETNTTTKVTVESIRQVFGVTPLTYPGWHDRKTTDHSHAQKILDAVCTKASPQTPPTQEAVEDAEPVVESQPLSDSAAEDEGKAPAEPAS